MRVITCLAASLFLQSAAFAQLAPETVGTTTMPAPGANWFIAKTSNGAYVWDAESGEMHGLLSLSRQTTTVAPYAPRGEFYAPESYYSRGVHGDRSDIVTVYDFENLAPIAEIDIPEKLAVLSIEGHLGLSNNGRFLGVFNMTPAQSITVVDVQNRAFVGEISTPGCAMILPVADRDFLMICGDGTLQLIRLDANGNEADRTRSNVFFSVQEDPVYDWPKRTRDGWLMISHAGKAYDVTIDGDDIDISEPWSIVTEEDAEEQWLPGGRQLFTVHRELGFLYALMHQGEQYTHHDPGTEIWVVDIEQRRRLYRIELETPAVNVMVTQESAPKLIVADEEGGLHVYDAIKMNLDHTIEDPGPGADLFVDF